MPRWIPGLAAVVLAVLALTALLTGEPEFIIPVVLVALLVLAYAGVNRLLTKRIAAKHGSIEDAMSSNDEGIPSTHLIPDDETPLGDTKEAHDEVTQHDLPLDHPGRHEAERRTESASDTTRGNQASPAN